MNHRFRFWAACPTDGTLFFFFKKKKILGNSGLKRIWVHVLRVSTTGSILDEVDGFSEDIGRLVERGRMPVSFSCRECVGKGVFLTMGVVEWSNVECVCLSPCVLAMDGKLDLKPDVKCRSTIMVVVDLQEFLECNIFTACLFLSFCWSTGFWLRGF